MVRFEKALPVDAVDLVGVALRAFAQEAQKYGHYPPGLDSTERHLKAMEEGIYYKIVAEGQIIGGVMIDDLGHDHYYLNTIFVDEAYQNQGIGAQAIKFMEKALPTAKKWRLKTPALSYSNHHFYEKLGYVKVKEVGPEAYPEDKNNLSFFVYEKEQV